VTFSGWESVARTLATALFAYLAIVLILRVSGKRTLSKWNAFDFIVTVALGSALATVILSRQTPLLDGVLAFVSLIGLQLVITWLSVRSPRIQRWVKASPALLLEDGGFLAENLRRERVTRSEVLAAIRGKGLAAVEDVAAVVLETDGSFSVIGKASAGARSALADARGGRGSEGDA
jgi:uncharacterized membrane protein YcaP (DUF421 family)